MDGSIEIVRSLDCLIGGWTDGRIELDRSMDQWIERGRYSLAATVSRVQQLQPAGSDSGDNSPGMFEYVYMSSYVRIRIHVFVCSILAPLVWVCRRVRVRRTAACMASSPVF